MRGVSGADASVANREIGVPRYCNGDLASHGIYEDVLIARLQFEVKLTARGAATTLKLG